MAIEIVSFPIKSGDFPVRDVNVYQRVCMKHSVKPQKNSVYTKITYIYILVFNEHGFWSPMYLQTLMFDKILYTVIFLTMLGFKY